MRTDRSSRLGVLWIAVALGAGLARPALADDVKQGKPVAVTGSPDEQAAQWLARGNKAFKQGHFAEAEEAYREAFNLKKGYDIAGNLGAAEMVLGKHRAAAQHLAFTLRLFPITGEPAVREQMQKALDQCRQNVGAVRVHTEPKGAEVWVDGERQGESPLADEVFVEPGEHAFEARLDGYTTTAQRVQVDKGAAVEVTLALAPVAQPAPVQQEARPKVVPPKRRSAVPGIAMGAVAVAGLAGGAAFLGVSAGKRSDAEAISKLIVGDHQSCVDGAANYDTSRCGGARDKAGAYVTYHNVAVGAFIVGGLAAAGTATYFLWPSRRTDMAGHDLRVIPVFGARDGAVMVSGSF